MELERELYGEVFEPLRDPTFFAQVSLDPELGMVARPNGADFSLEFLYQVGQSAKGDLSKDARKRTARGQKAIRRGTKKPRMSC